MMSWWSILRTARFVKFYTILTLTMLACTLIFNLLGFIVGSAMKGIAATLTIVGIFLLFGQIIITMNLTNRNDRIGWILIRFSYIILFVIGIGLVLIAGSTFLASMYILGANSTLASVFISAFGLTIIGSFGICLTAVAFHTISINDVWILV
ncbi:MAG: hypothetical protein RTU30_14165 [Candidatus Thorarchaeota archaeon]